MAKIKTGQQITGCKTGNWRQKNLAICFMKDKVLEKFSAQFQNIWKYLTPGAFFFKLKFLQFLVFFDVFGSITANSVS